MNLTIAFIVTTVFSWIVFDFYIIAKKGKSESISAHIIRMSKKYPLIPFMVGGLCGHLFWTMNSEDIYKNLKCSEIIKEEK